MQGKLFLEISIAKEQVEYPIPDQHLSFINEFLNFENGSKYFLNIPIDWIGLKKGVLHDTLRYFRTAVWVGIAYVTPDFNERVIDFDGRGDLSRGMTCLEIVQDSRRVAKYVKKDMLIISCLNEDKGHYHINGYITDTKSSQPIVQVLDMYLIESELGMTVNDFVAGLSRDRVIKARQLSEAKA